MRREVLTVNEIRPEITIEFKHRPIESFDEDIFGWENHAKMLAKLITNEKNDDVALGISAPWGSGKTSMLNLIKEQINKLKIQPKPIIVEFDPWFYGSEDKVIHSFFETLAKAIFKENHPTREAISKAMGYLSKILTKTPDLPSTFTPNPLITEAINFTKQLLGALAGDLKDCIGYGFLNSFLDIKKLLILLLTEAQRKKELPQIIIMVDDLDRLQADEALTMLKIIRLVTDLPCIRSIVAFDEEATGQLISNKFNIDGINYIRKMINVPTYLPTITGILMERYLFSSMMKIVGKDRLNENFNISKMSMALKFIKSVRLAKTVFNMFNIGFSCLEHQIDIADYFMLCVIYNIAPVVFSKLKNVEPPFENVNRKVMMQDYSLNIDQFQRLCKIDDFDFAKLMHNYLFSTFKERNVTTTPEWATEKSIIWYVNWEYYFSYFTLHENMLLKGRYGIRK